MATTHKWGDLSAKATALSTTNLNNLADGASIMSSAISNDTDLYIYADFRLKLSAQTANRTAGTYIGLHILADLGDSTYASSTPLNANSWVGNFIQDSAAGTLRYDVIWNVVLPPSNFKVLLENNTGVIFTSCSILEYVKYYMQST